jgi:hypothetical protein
LLGRKKQVRVADHVARVRRYAYNREEQRDVLARLVECRWYKLTKAATQVLASPKCSGGELQSPGNGWTLSLDWAISVSTRVGCSELAEQRGKILRGDAEASGSAILLRWWQQWIDCK